MDKFDFGTDRAIHIRVTCPFVFHRQINGKLVRTDDSDFSFDQKFIRLADNKDRHKISDNFDFGPLLTISMSRTRHFVSSRHTIGKCCPDDSDFSFDRDLLKDRHKISDKLDFGLLLA